MSLSRLARSWERSVRPAPLDTGQDKPSGFEMLTRYIPTETVTLYVGAMAAREDIAKLLKVDDATWPIYWTFAALTPLLLLLLMLNRHRTSGATTPFKAHWWPFAASVAAFLVWATSVPGHPVAQELKALPAFAALFVSVVLSLLEPILGSRKS